MILDVSREARNFLKNFLNTSGQKSKRAINQNNNNKEPPAPQWEKTDLWHQTTTSKRSGNEKNGKQQ